MRAFIFTSLAILGLGASAVYPHAGRDALAYAQYPPRPDDPYDSAAPVRPTYDPYDRGGPFVQRDLIPVYRFFHPDSLDYLLTARPEAESSVVFREYIPEGVVFLVAPRPGPDLVPLYRFFTPSGSHFYATSSRAGARFSARLERIVGYISAEPRPGLRALHAWYHPVTDRHFYTLDPRGEFAARQGFVPAGVVGYVVPPVR
jgi:hypothetical protein